MGYGNFFSWPGKTTNIWASGRGMENATPAPTVTRWKWGRDSGADNRYMNYRDNPRRPRMQFWFGGAVDERRVRLVAAGDERGQLACAVKSPFSGHTLIPRRNKRQR